MTLFKKSLYTLILVALIGAQAGSAFEVKETTRYFNGPTVSSVNDTSASLSLSAQVLADITEEEKSGIYFEYGETHQVCIMIYPTPEYCLPKKTKVGLTSATITGLKPTTSYTVTYKRDNTIRCITTPCPSNEFQSLSVEFTTKTSTGTPAPTPAPTPTPTPAPQPMPVGEVTQNLHMGSRGPQVTILQNILIQGGFLKMQATGYFGIYTKIAVSEFQRMQGIIATGFVGPLTRKALFRFTVSPPILSAETFEGTITAYSQQCFVDGECSITVDGKKIVTTTGWSQEIVGTVTGIPDFGSIESKVGARAKVYAKKTNTGYTLYGSSDYYIQIQ